MQKARRGRIGSSRIAHSGDETMRKSREVQIVGVVRSGLVGEARGAKSVENILQFFAASRRRERRSGHAVAWSGYYGLTFKASRWNALQYVFDRSISARRRPEVILRRPANFGQSEPERNEHSATLTAHQETGAAAANCIQHNKRKRRTLYDCSVARHAVHGRERDGIGF
jgi:hypothetical protein